MPQDALSGPDLNQVPPHNQQAELELLGCLLFGRDDPRITPGRFYFGSHRLIYSAIVELRAEGRPVEATIVLHELNRLGQLDDSGGVRKLIEAMESVPHADHVGHYADLVIDACRRRQLIEHGQQLQRLAFDPTADIDQAASFDLSAVLDEGRPERFPALTCSQLDRGRFDLRYLVSGLLVEGQPCVVAGEKKTLKTNLLIDLSLSLATGSPFLQRFEIPNPVGVGLLSGESGRATIQETARRIARSKGYDLEYVDGVLFCFDLPRLGDAADERQVQRFISDNDLRVLVIDPAYLCMAIGDDAGNLFKVGRLLSGITRIGEATGCTMIVCHHTRKRPKDKPYAAPELEHIAWSGFQEWARQWVLIGRRSPYCPDQGGQHRLWLSFGGSAGHSGLWGVDIEEGTRQDAGGRRWDVEILTIAEINERREADRDEERDDDARDAIIRHLQANQSGDTKTGIRDAARINSSRCGTLLDLMVDEGLIEPCEVRKIGRSLSGFRLPIRPGQWDHPDTRTTPGQTDLSGSPGQPGQHPDNPCPTASDDGGAAHSPGVDGNQSDTGAPTPVGGGPLSVRVTSAQDEAALGGPSHSTNGRLPHE